MGDSSQEVIPRQEVESVKRSEMCTGLNRAMMTLPSNGVISIGLTQSVINSILDRTELVMITQSNNTSNWSYNS